MSWLLFTTTLISVGVGVGAITLSVAIMMPLNGVVTRLRAQYSPKHFQLDPKYDTQPHAGPVITSFFVMLVRICRIEGLSGLYKGLVPMLLDASMPILLVPLLLLINNLNDGFNWKFLFYGIGGVLLLDMSNLLHFTPLVVLINRAIITRHKLPYSGALDSLQVLSTPTERRRPLIFLRMFGIWSVVTIQNSYLNLFTMIRNRFLGVPQLGLGQLPNEGFLLEFAMALALALANTLVLTPLQVITLRLSLQRTNVPSESISSSKEEGNAMEVMGDFEAGEKVINLRVDSEVEPYTDPIDCARKIINEEGWGALYRAWWWTTFTLLILF